MHNWGGLTPGQQARRGAEDGWGPPPAAVPLRRATPDGGHQWGRCRAHWGNACLVRSFVVCASGWAWDEGQRDGGANHTNRPRRTMASNTIQRPRHHSEPGNGGSISGLTMISDDEGEVQERLTKLVCIPTRSSHQETQRCGHTKGQRTFDDELHDELNHMDG